jgi:hypothetical protein
MVERLSDDAVTMPQPSAAPQPSATPQEIGVCDSKFLSNLHTLKRLRDFLIEENIRDDSGEVPDITLGSLNLLHYNEKMGGIALIKNGMM